MLTAFRFLVVLAIAEGVAMLAHPRMAWADSSAQVTTRITVHSGEGYFDARFVARPRADGGWDVNADFHPHDIYSGVYQPPALWELRGTGRGSVSAVQEVPIGIMLTGWRWHRLNHYVESFPAEFQFTIVVDAAGVVRISSVP